jgi:hypothetical protein
MRTLLPIPMRTTAAICICLATFCPADEVRTVPGTVTDAGGNPLPAVTWSIAATEQWRDDQWNLVHADGDSWQGWQGVTDENGRFKIPFRGKVRYDLQFDKAGYGPAFVYQVSADSPDVRVTMGKGVPVRGLVRIKGQDQPNYAGVTVVLRLPNPRGSWYRRTTLVDHEGRYRFLASLPPAVPGRALRPVWQLVCAGKVVPLEVKADARTEEVEFEVTATATRNAPPKEQVKLEASTELAEQVAAGKPR